MPDRPSPEALVERRQDQIDLHGLSYARADLTDLEIEDGDLRDVDFRGARLDCARLVRCELGGADFRGAKTEGATLIGCTLDGARFDLAALEQIEFVDCGGDPVLPEEPMSIWGGEVPPATWLAFTQGRTRGLSMPGLRLRSLPDDADFSGADLSGVTLRGAELERVDLSGANLTGAVLKGCFFGECDLSGACLDGADLRDAQFEECTMKGVRLRGIKTDNRTSLGELDGVDWSGEDLRKILREGMVQGGTDLDLRGADLRGCSLWGAFVRLDLRGARCDRVELFDVEFEGVDFSQASLREAHILGTSSQPVLFAGADLRGAIFNVDFPGADFTGADLRQLGFDKEPSQLRGATFDGADLRQAELIGVDLEGASFRDADLRGALLLDVRLDGTDFAGARLEGTLCDEDALAALGDRGVGTPSLYVPPPPPPPREVRRGRHVELAAADAAPPEVLARARALAAHWATGDVDAARAGLAEFGLRATADELLQLERLLLDTNHCLRNSDRILVIEDLAVCMVLAKTSPDGFFWGRGGEWTSRAKQQTLCFAVVHPERQLLAVGLTRGRTPAAWSLLTPWGSSPARNRERALSWVRRGAKDRVLIAAP